MSPYKARWTRSQTLLPPPPPPRSYDKWFAYYDETYYFPYDFKIWQYTNKGKVSGIKGDVDLNVSFDAQEYEEPLPLRQQIADKAHIVKADPHRRVTHLLAYLPDIEGHGDGI